MIFFIAMSGLFLFSSLSIFEFFWRDLLFYFSEKSINIDMMEHLYVYSEREWILFLRNSLYQNKLFR